MKKLSVLFVISILFFTASAHAAGLSAQDKKDLTRIENYMNAMPPTHAEFIQETSDGKTYEGEFWIKRPGRLRFEYKNPSHNFVVADGLFIHFWDAKMKEASDAPIGQTLWLTLGQLRCISCILQLPKHSTRFGGRLIRDQRILCCDLVHGGLSPV